jgi:AAA+ ATPase superfamily predicted ATPase
VVTSFIWPCGRCKNCALGRENLCENFAKVRLKGTLLDGTTKLRDATAGGARWSDVKRLLQAEKGRPISDSEVTKLLRNLVDYGFLEKRGELYAVPAPVLRRALRDIQCLI